MDQHISLMILIIILMMISGYKKTCNVSQLIYRGFEVPYLTFDYSEDLQE